MQNILLIRKFLIFYLSCILSEMFHMNKMKLVSCLQSRGAEIQISIEFLNDHRWLIVDIFQLN